MNELSKTKISILRQLHLKGSINWGSMAKNERVPMLKELENDGYIVGISVTEKGVNASL